MVMEKEKTYEISIPAPPRGASSMAMRTSRRRKFQYQPLHEGLRRTPGSARDQDISIPAPPRGASQLGQYYMVPYNISIPAPPRGASVTDHRGSAVRGISIPAPPRGASDVPLDTLRRCDFNTSPSTRGFGLLQGQSQCQYYFNTSPSTRGFFHAVVMMMPI